MLKESYGLQFNKQWGWKNAVLDLSSIALHEF